jgi:3-phenylpropionate/trans-cinnamate dioxygenase ferredoxin reductase subunit
MHDAAPGMVIVGAGEAGARAAMALREHGFAGGIVLIGEEGAAPYERPPLSKAVMTAADEPTATVIATHDRLAAAGVAFRHDMVERIDRDARDVVCASGERVAYEKLLLATGARPRTLPIPGAGHALYLRTFADALALRARLRSGAHLVVVGGGFIGLEVAASAVARGCRVTVLEAAPRILMRGVPAEIAAHVAALHRGAGVDLRTAVAIAGFEADGVVLADGSEIACDGIVVGVGAAPETGLAAAAGLALDNGVAVDATLRTSDPAIYAAGDCCSFPSPLYDGRRLRLEAWRNAQGQGTLAARNMLGAGLAYDAVPWFWSDQYTQTLQVAGLPDMAATSVRREVGDGALLFFHIGADGRLVAASGIGTLALSKDIRVAEILIARGARPDPAALAAPETRLRSLLAA